VSIQAWMKPKGNTMHFDLQATEKSLERKKKGERITRVEKIDEV
jgi:hypothetical protein